MDNKAQTSKTIDWELCLKLANNRPELAKELLTLLVNELPQVRANINEAYENKDYPALHRYIHKLHGATCYCGVPKLKEIAALLEAKLKKSNSDEIKKLLKILNDEMDQLLKTFDLSVSDK